MEDCINQKNETDTNCTVGGLNESKIPPILQFLAGLIGNGMAVFILIKTSKSHKWKPFYRLVFALALTDAVVSCLAYPIVLKRYISNFTYCLSDYECNHVSFVYSFAFLGSAMLVTSMSIDRFMAIVFPFAYNRGTIMLRTMIMMAVSWILASVICLLPIVGVGRVKLYYPGSWCFINFSSKETGNMIVTYIYAVLGLFLFIITATANITVIATLLRRIIQSKKKLGVHKRLKSDIYIVVCLLGIVLLFTICWVPLLSRMIYNVNIDCPTDGKTELLVLRLAVSNSIVDPWIYIVLRKENFEFVEHVIRRFRRRSSYTPESTIDGTPSPSLTSVQSREMGDTSNNDTNQTSDVGKESVFTVHADRNTV